MLFSIQLLFIHVEIHGKELQPCLALCWHKMLDASAPLVFFLTEWGGTEGQEPGPWHSSSWTTKGPQSTLQMSPSFSSGVNIHKSFFSDLWLTLMGSFISILIGCLSKGAYSAHFFWRNLQIFRISETLNHILPSKLLFPPLSPISSCVFLQLPSFINSSWFIKQVNTRKSYQDVTSFHTGCWSLAGN